MPPAHAPQNGLWLPRLGLAGVLTAVQLGLLSLGARSTPPQNAATGPVWPTLRKTLARGEVLTKGHLTLTQIPLPEGPFASPRLAESMVGMRVRFDLPMGSPLPLAAFPPPGVPLTSRIPVGKRLFLLISDASLVPSVLSPGDVVDVLAHIQLPDQQGQATETLLECLEVQGFAGDLDGAPPAGQNQSVAFFLDPDEVKLLGFMKAFARFELSLRNPSDKTRRMATSAALTMNRFLADPRIQAIRSQDVFQIRRGLAGASPHVTPP